MVTCLQLFSSRQETKLPKLVSKEKSSKRIGEVSSLSMDCNIMKSIVFIPKSKTIFTVLIFDDNGVEKIFSWYYTFHVYSDG